jgi:hypothetical protein
MRVGRQAKLCMKTVNLEAGMPTVPAALARLEDVLRAARKEQCAALKIIHGYGSSGAGGALRQKLQAELAQRALRGEVRAFIAGEDWRISNQDSWELLNACPELRKDPDLGRGNKGISVVVL